jgi:molybdate transport system ATP-binding protein
MSGVALRAVVESRGTDIEFDVAAGEVLALLGPTARASRRRCT